MTRLWASLFVICALAGPTFAQTTDARSQVKERHHTDSGIVVSVRTGIGLGLGSIKGADGTAIVATARAGYEVRPGLSTRFTVTPQMMFTHQTYEFISKGTTTDYSIQLGLQASYYFGFVGKGAFSIWGEAGFGLGNAVSRGDGRFGLASQTAVGLDYMFRPEFGIGIFGGLSGVFWSDPIASMERPGSGYKSTSFNTATVQGGLSLKGRIPLTL
jgi:hypothetical protein